MCGCGEDYLCPRCEMARKGSLVEPKDQTKKPPRCLRRGKRFGRKG